MFGTYKDWYNRVEDKSKIIVVCNGKVVRGNDRAKCNACEVIGFYIMDDKVSIEVNGTY